MKPEGSQGPLDLIEQRGIPVAETEIVRVCRRMDRVGALRFEQSFETGDEVTTIRADPCWQPHHEVPSIPSGDTQAFTQPCLVQTDFYRGRLSPPLHPRFLGKNTSDHLDGVLPKQRLIGSQHDTQPLAPRELCDVAIT